MPLGKVWTSINLAIGPHTCTEFEEAFYERRMQIHPTASKMMCGVDFEVTTQPRRVNLVAIYPSELKLHRPNLPELYTAAKSKGLKLCPKDVAPQTCLQYLAYREFISRSDPKLPSDHEWYIIATEPLRDIFGNGRLFDVLRLGNEKWLHNYLVYPDRRWSNASPFIFMKDE